MKVLLLVLSLVSLAYGARITVCGGSASVDVNSVQVTGCQGSDRCIFNIGGFANLTLPFVTHTQVSSVTPVVHGIIAGVPVPFSLPNRDGCVNSGLSCPLAPNVLQTYRASLPIKKVYPPIPLVVQWVLMSGNEELVCLKIPVKLSKN